MGKKSSEKLYFYGNFLDIGSIYFRFKFDKLDNIVHIMDVMRWTSQLK